MNFYATTQSLHWDLTQWSTTSVNFFEHLQFLKDILLENMDANMSDHDYNLTTLREAWEGSDIEDIEVDENSSK